MRDPGQAALLEVYHRAGTGPQTVACPRGIRTEGGAHKASLKGCRHCCDFYIEELV